MFFRLENGVCGAGWFPEMRPGRGGTVSQGLCTIYKVELAVVVYHVAIVAIGHGLLKNFWPMVIGCVLRNAGSSY